MPSTFPDKDPALAVDAHGNVNVAWSDSIPDNTSVTLDILFSRSRDEGRAFQNPKVLTANTGLSAITPKLALDRGGEAYLVWQANGSSMPSQVFFARVPSSFSQPVDFDMSVSPKRVNASPGETLQFEVTGRDLDDVRNLNLACSLLPASTANLISSVFESTCTFDPASISRSERTAQLTLTIPPMLLSGSYFLGVAGVAKSTFNIETIQVNVGE